jgi:hypothetical protein
MSAPLPGWYSTMQERPIDQQLEDGIRGLQLDTYYADKLPNGRLRTEIPEGGVTDGVSPDAVAAAMRIRERLGFSGEGERGMYLCHTFCELGATPVGEMLDQLRDFLVLHPGEVVMVVNQDYVTPADFVAAVREAGLERFVYRGGAPFPTLGELVESGHRLILRAENHAGAAPWYRLAYEKELQETPYHFTRVAQLVDPGSLKASCAPNRGPKDAPLFLLNHWITTDPAPLPSLAGEVNSAPVLLARARECQRLRGRFPNLIAVNFYRQGDLFRAVDELNGF